MSYMMESLRYKEVSYQMYNTTVIGLIHVLLSICSNNKQLDLGFAVVKFEVGTDDPNWG